MRGGGGAVGAAGASAGEGVGRGGDGATKEGAAGVGAAWECEEVQHTEETKRLGRGAGVGGLGDATVGHMCVRVRNTLGSRQCVYRRPKTIKMMVRLNPLIITPQIITPNPLFGHWKSVWGYGGGVAVWVNCRSQKTSQKAPKWAPKVDFLAFRLFFWEMDTFF